MTPTMFMRFVWRDEVVERTEHSVTTRKVRVLQQFWQAKDGNHEVAFGAKVLSGVWRNVPMVDEE